MDFKKNVIKVLQVEDYISQIGEYFKGIEKFNDALIVRIQLPDKWGVYPSADGRIKPAVSETTPNEYFYYGDSGEVKLEEIFQLIIETIQMNKDVLIKIELLKDKVNELKELFDTKTLEELKTLKFVTEKPKAKRTKRKYTRRSKVATNEPEQPLDESKRKEEDNSEEKQEKKSNVEKQDKTTKVVEQEKDNNKEEIKEEK